MSKPKRTDVPVGALSCVTLFLHHVASSAKRGKPPPRQPTVWDTHSQCSLKLTRSPSLRARHPRLPTSRYESATPAAIPGLPSGSVRRSLGGREGSAG